MNGDFLGAFLLAIGSGELQDVVTLLVEGDGGAGSGGVHELRTPPSGPETWDHVVVTSPSAGRPSSFTVPTSLAPDEVLEDT